MNQVAAGAPPAMTDALARMRVNPNVTIKMVNIAFLDQVAAERGTIRSRILDEMLDLMRAEHAQAVQEVHAGRKK